MADTQTLANHTRFVPAFHFFALPVLVANFVWAVVRLVQQPGIDAGFAVLMAAALIVVAFCARVFALTAQDRVIRLEMRQRLASVLPKERQTRIPELTRGQLVALRFASDGELPELFDRVMKDNVQNRKAIKQMIKTWTGDHLRV